MKTASGGFYCVLYFSIVNKIKTIKILHQIEVNYTRVFNITFIGFKYFSYNSLQTIWMSDQKKKVALLKGPGN